MDLTWLASSVEAFAMATIACLVWSMHLEPSEPQRKEVSRCVEADAEDPGVKRPRASNEILTHPDCTRVFIGS